MQRLSSVRIYRAVARTACCRVINAARPRFPQAGFGSSGGQCEGSRIGKEKKKKSVLKGKFHFREDNS